MAQDRPGGLHESFDREEAVELSSDRSFGLVMAGILALIGAIGFLRGSQHWPWWCGAAAIFGATALAAPGLLGPVNRLWARLGLLLAAIVSPVVLAMLFYLCITPIGLLMRWAGKDPLRLRFQPDADSYWIRRNPAGPAPDTLKNQY
ncbi:SxtJ family membrane protein [Bradyrhizobium liaoningense]|uniref:SxtJ family membrane protein n=1 Tax=Bradyrhizobium liaoningense TaxID=43992 RepID=UPI001BA7DE32|nr:SxtJ family membrane protein [Bradyrhizobium liaoningense]MBR0714739.1 hypothetical protein [Bradyrhizobium liaoningense]